MTRISDAVPYREGAVVRRHQDLQREVQMQAAARRLERSQIGNGGVLKIDGTLQVTGDLEVPAGSLSSSANMTAGVDVVAGQDVSAVRDVLAGRDVAAVAQVRGDNGLFPGGINSVDVYNRLVTGSGSFRSTSANILGQLGQTVSSRRYKQDIEAAVIPRETLRALRLVFFRYTASVPFSQEQQPTLLGLIAEEVHALGLTWLVIYSDAGQPEALVDFALPYLGLMLAQLNADDLDELREQNADIERRLQALEARA